MEISDVDLGWLAGLLEGEGSFMMNRSIVSGKLYLYPKITVTMTDEDVIAKAASMMGNSVYKVPKDKNFPDRKQQWRTSVSGVRAAELMQKLLSYMGVRRSGKIREILDAYGEIEPTSVRRARACSESAKKRWAMYGTREGRLPEDKLPGRD